MKKSIELTLEEAQVLVNLIHIAIKTEGLNSAEAGVYFKKLIDKAFENKSEEINKEVN